MTAYTVPAELEPRDGRLGEHAVWQQLRDELPDGTTLLYDVKVPSGPDGRQVDLLVLWPDVGIAVVEVKGGAVSCDRGRWTSHRNGDAKPIDNPMEQVATARHELCRFLTEAGYAAARARVQHLVVLPHQVLDGGFDPSSCPREQVVDRDDLPDLVPRLRALVEQGHGFSPLRAEAVPALVRLFEQQLAVDPTAASAEHEQWAEHLAEQQVDVLDLLSRQPSFEVEGGAGTGKTGLALAQAQRLAKEGRRVALLCYSRGLGMHLTREAATWKRPPAYVGTFEGLALAWGVPPGSGDAWFETEMAEALVAQAAARDDRFDAVVVDEAQDFGRSWWDAVRAVLRTEHGLFAFLDDDQRVFHRQAEPPVSVAPFLLRRNYRNTVSIAQTCGSLATTQSTYAGRRGPAVRFVSCATEDALERAEDAVEALLDTWAPGQVALLTTSRRHPLHAEQVTQDHDAYWRAFFDAEEVFYCSVPGFKGLERTCVVLAVNGLPERSRVQQLLYVGMSRARAQLVVVGDLDVIAPTGQRAGLRRRLEAAQAWQPPSTRG